MGSGLDSPADLSDSPQSHWRMRDRNVLTANLWEMELSPSYGIIGDEMYRGKYRVLAPLAVFVHDLNTMALYMILLLTVTEYIPPPSSSLLPPIQLSGLCSAGCVVLPPFPFQPLNLHLPPSLVPNFLGLARCRLPDCRPVSHSLILPPPPPPLLLPPSSHPIVARSLAAFTLSPSGHSHIHHHHLCHPSHHEGRARP